MFTTIKKKLLKKPAIAIVQFTYVLLYCIHILLFDTLNLNGCNITFTINRKSKFRTVFSSDVLYTKQISLS